MQTCFPDQFASVHGMRLRYWQCGERGSPVLLLHGVLGSLENWRLCMDALGRRHRVFAMEAPGHGLSEPDSTVRDVSVMRELIGGFVRGMGLGSTAVVAHSGAGVPALELALEHSRLVRQLVLVDSAGIAREINPQLRIGTLAPLPPFLPTLRRAEVRFIVEHFMFADARKVSAEIVEDVHVNLARSGNIRRGLAMLRTGVDVRGQKYAFLERLPAVAVPTLIVWGQQDRQIPVAHARLAARHIPGARLCILDPCGHMPMLERSADFSRAVLEFLSGGDHGDGH